MSKPSAAILIIGDEILSGKTEDVNGPFLIQQLNSQGVRVQSLTIIPDDLGVISQKVRELSGQVDWLFTSGGIGPTPDDMTMQAIAMAFGVKLELEAKLKESIEGFFGGNCTKDHLKMAMVPQGLKLHPTRIKGIYGLQFLNLFIFPGVPHFLRENFSALKEKFQGEIYPCLELNLEVDEALLSGAIQEALDQNPLVKIGSYPRFEGGVQKVRLILEHPDRQALEQVVAFLSDRFQGL